MTCNFSPRTMGMGPARLNACTQFVQAGRTQLGRRSSQPCKWRITKVHFPPPPRLTMLMYVRDNADDRSGGRTSQQSDSSSVGKFRAYPGWSEELRVARSAVLGDVCRVSRATASPKWSAGPPEDKLCKPQCWMRWLFQE